MRVAVIAITKNGKAIANKIRSKINCDIFMPLKFKGDDDITYYESTPSIIPKIFNSYDALICIFALGAVIRLIAKHLNDKKSDPAVIVIDDKAKFVISALSGHLGGANELTKRVAEILDAIPIITTAADVNETIAVDLLGREFNWEIEYDKNLTSVSADMVNGEIVGVYQDAGEKNWLNNLPKNIKVFDSLDALRESDCRSLIITDKIIDNRLLERAVLYRPKSLVVGVGLHYNTSKEEISKGIRDVFERHALSLRSIKMLATVDKGVKVKGLEEYAKENNLPIIYYKKEELAGVQVPNPSDVVKMYENIASVAEASALLASNGELIVEKQKYPPNLTIAVARIKYE